MPELGKGKIAMARWQLVPGGDIVEYTCTAACVGNSPDIAMIVIGMRS